MKSYSLYLVIISLFLIMSLHAQTEIPKWRFGAGVSLSSLRMQKGEERGFIEIFANNKQIHITRVGSRLGWNINGTVSYYLGAHWRLQSEIGLTYAREKVYRKIENDGSFFGISYQSTEWDTINAKYLLLDLPIYCRWQIVREDRPDMSFFLFLDAGATAAFPLSNKSSFSFRDTDGNYGKGKLKFESLVFPFLGIGFKAGQNIGISVRWTYMLYDVPNDLNENYNTFLTRYMFKYYF